MRRLSFFVLSAAFSLFGSDIELVSKTEGVLSSEMLSRYKELFGLHSFIETGTYAGDTTAIASTIFSEVHSIEIWEPLYTAAKKRFSDDRHVFLYLGDTTAQLSQMIGNSTEKRLYWLDAHCSGGGTGGIAGFSPILHELDQILSDQKDIDSVILIDDLRGLCHIDERSNLPLRLIVKKIHEISPDLQFYSIGDIGVVFNRKTYPFVSVSDLVENTSFSRFFDPDCEDIEKLIEAESFIASYTEKTAEGKALSQLVRWVNRDNLGGEAIYLLWEALRELERRDLAAAIHDLELVANSFYGHWRIDAYLVKALLLDGQMEKAVSRFNERLLEAYGKYPKLIESIISL